ncbi:MAG: YdcF family protein [Rhizobiales bacterium]|nr:YdcF family protein [Hyphomicrobiales bacterium]
MRGIRHAIRSLVMAGIFGFVVWLAGLFAFVETLGKLRAPFSPQADGIIVLTGGAERIGDGIRLLEEKRARRLFISGVNIQVSAEQLRRTWPGHEAAFECCIDLDFRARNTIENAFESAEWVKKHGFRSVILVTARYHMPRAKLEFAAAMPGIAIEPYPVLTGASRIEDWWREPTLIRLYASEFTKFCAVWLKQAVS